MNDNDIVTKIKCFLGLHPIPENHIFSSMGAIFKGGVCPNCEKLKHKFLMNAWATEKQTNGAVFLQGTNPELLEGLESGLYVWDKGWQNQIDEAKAATVSE